MATLEKTADDLGLKLTMETKLDVDIPAEMSDTDVDPSAKKSLSSKLSSSVNNGDSVKDLVEGTSEMQLNQDPPSNEGVPSSGEINPSAESLDQNGEVVAEEQQGGGGSPPLVAEHSSENFSQKSESKEDSQIKLDAKTSSSDDMVQVTDSSLEVTEESEIPKNGNPSSEAISLATDTNVDSYAHSDAGSEKTDFESMISAILENDDGNEADVETLTEMHSIYAQSRLSMSGAPTRPEMYRSLAQSMAERLVQSALLAGSRDNITAMVILLPGCKI